MANRVCDGYAVQADGELPQVLIKNHHDAIISMEDFRRVQELKIERSKIPAQEISMDMTY